MGASGRISLSGDWFAPDASKPLEHGQPHMVKITAGEYPFEIRTVTPYGTGKPRNWVVITGKIPVQHGAVVGCSLEVLKRLLLRQPEDHQIKILEGSLEAE